MANFKRLGKNLIWLVQTIPAFMDRYDDLGQQNPLAPERIEEMWAVIRMYRRTINEVYNKSEREHLHHALDNHVSLLNGLIELDRNATCDETTAVMGAINNVTELMIKAQTPSAVLK